VVLDGAMGTELERRRAAHPAPLWSAGALLDAPQAVKAIHAEYVRAGADILVANTFRTNPRTLRAAGVLDQGPALNALAVSLARQAAAHLGKPGGQVLVAASVAPVEDCYRPDLVPSESELWAEHSQMMEWLAAAGPDLIWIETMNTLREAGIAARVAATIGLPVAISFVVRENGDLLGGDRLEDAVAAVEPARPVAIGLNCIPPRGLSRILPRLRQATGRRLAAYAHIGNPVPIRGWSFSEDMHPVEYAEYARQWLGLGALIIGGCCGTGPAHIQAVRRMVDQLEN